MPIGFLFFLSGDFKPTGFDSEQPVSIVRNDCFGATKGHWVRTLLHVLASNHQKVLNNQWPTLRVFHPPGCCRVHCEYCKITGKWDNMRNTI